MHKKFSVVLSFLFAALALSAQEQLAVQGTAPDLHVLHTVAPKENWYSVGRLFNISPKEIAPYNGLTIDKPLSIGQQLKVPLTGSNFSQNGGKAEDEVFIPVYHTVQDKEWMFRISTNYNKVPLENLEKWNNITRDQTKAGMKLIVGYLKVKQGQSPLAVNGTGAIKTIPATAPPAPAEKAALPKTEPVASQQTKTDNTPPPVEKTTAAKPEPVAKQETKTENPLPAEEKKLVVNKPEPTPPNTGTVATGGYFKAMYEQSGKAKSGAAGVFKSVSGWQDGKYYALISNVAVGTIIKVSNPATNKAVFVKVLSQLPDMKESAGLTIRISDAAAAALGTSDGIFPVEISY